MSLNLYKIFRSIFISHKLVLCLISAFMLLLVCSEGCEVQQFDYRGYRCESDLHCLAGFHCDKAKKTCVVTQREPLQEKASSTEQVREKSRSEKQNDALSEPKSTEVLVEAHSEVSKRD